MQERRALAGRKRRLRQLPLAPLATFSATPGTRLADLSTDEVRGAFVSDGLVLFRGFRPSPAELFEFTRPYTASYFHGYGRVAFPEVPAITAVNETPMALEPHCDNGIRPESMRPQITWLWCERPSESGGETTFSDGVTIWQRLGEEARARFRSQRVSYVSLVQAAAWRALGHADTASFERFLTTIGASAWRVDERGTFEVEIRSPAVHKPRWTDAPAFIGSLLVAGSRGFEGMAARFEDGTPISSALRDEVRGAFESCVREVRWDAGDVAMLDNTRFLHGRRAYTDTGRRAYLIQTLQASF